MKLKMTAISILTLSLLFAGCSKKPEESDTPQESGSSETVEPDETSKPDETIDPSAPTAEEKAAEYLASMSTEDKAAQLISMAVRIWNEENFTVMNDEVRAMFEKYHFGGICLFRENMTSDSRQTIELTQALQAAVTQSGGAPLLISTDQEGGSIYRLSSGTTTPGNMALSASGKTENAEKAGTIIGRELSALGINTDFAPDADVNSNPANPVIGIRSFSDDPETVSTFTDAFVSGLSKNNIVAALKHFPGHGDTAVDSHTGLPLIEKTKEELHDSDLIPFRQMIQAGYSDMIMSAHIQFPNIETGTYTSITDGTPVYLPATLSKTFMTDIVRTELGFEGVVITDSMIMDSIAVHFNPMDAASLAINAGADMILMPLDVRGTEGLAAVDRYMSGLTAMINNGTIPMARVDEAVGRILTLKYRRGIMDEQYNSAKTEEMKKNASAVGSAEFHQEERKLADEAVTVVENNGVLPLRADSNMSFVFSGMNDSQTNMLAYSFNVLCSEGIIPDECPAIVNYGNWTNGYGEIYNALPETDVLILTDSMWSADLIDTVSNAQIPEVVRLIDTAHSYGVKVIVISCALPYDLPLLSNADALIAVYNSYGLAECDANFNPLCTYGPNLLGALDVIFGKVSPRGKLPVNIPQIANGYFLDGNAYNRGDGLTW